MSGKCAFDGYAPAPLVPPDRGPASARLPRAGPARKGAEAQHRKRQSRSIGDDRRPSSAGAAAIEPEIDEGGLAEKKKMSIGCDDSAPSPSSPGSWSSSRNTGASMAALASTPAIRETIAELTESELRPSNEPGREISTRANARRHGPVSTVTSTKTIARWDLRRLPTIITLGILVRCTRLEKGRSGRSRHPYYASRFSLCSGKNVESPITDNADSVCGRRSGGSREGARTRAAGVVTAPASQAPCPQRP